MGIRMLIGLVAILGLGGCWGPIVVHPNATGGGTCAGVSGRICLPGETCRLPPGQRHVQDALGMCVPQLGTPCPYEGHGCPHAMQGCPHAEHGCPHAEDGCPHAEHACPYAEHTCPHATHGCPHSKGKCAHESPCPHEQH